MPRRERARLLLRGLAKLLAVVLVAGAVGTALGLALSKLTGDDEPPAAITPDPTSPVPRPTTAAAPSDSTTSTPRPSGQHPLEPIRVTVVSAVLHPSASPSGQRRRRARLGVRVKVENPGTQRVVLPRPSLLTARQRTPTDPAADGPKTRLGAINPGQTVDVTLRFETAGAVTRELTTQKRARILVGRRSSPVTITVGAPVTSSAGSSSTSSDTFFE